MRLGWGDGSLMSNPNFSAGKPALKEPSMNPAAQMGSVPVSPLQAWARRGVRLAQGRAQSADEAEPGAGPGRLGASQRCEEGG